MSRNGSVDLDLGEETYRFRLGIGDLEDLQDATGLGAHEHLVRLYDGNRHTFRHAREIVRFGMIGGGLDVREASSIMRTLDDLPASQVAAVALLTIAAALEVPDEDEIPFRGGKADTDPLPDGRMRFAGFYAVGAAMSLAPSELRKMSMWQFQAHLAGFNRAQNPDGPDPITSAEEDALWAWINGPEAEQPKSEALADGN